MANQYLDPTDPVISMLSNEMESKNVPPQQAESYLASQGRQVPGQLAYLMLMNQRLKAAQPQPMPQSTVAQDLQMAMQGQGQVQQPQGPIQPNPTQQQLQRQTMPQQNPMQQGIGQLPQQAVGQPTAYKGGGIVAFNEGGVPYSGVRGMDYGDLMQTVYGYRLEPEDNIKKILEEEERKREEKRKAEEEMAAFTARNPSNREGPRTIHTKPVSQDVLGSMGYLNPDILAGNASSPGALIKRASDKRSVGAPKQTGSFNDLFDAMDSVLAGGAADNAGDIPEVAITGNRRGDYERLLSPEVKTEEEILQQQQERRQKSGLTAIEEREQKLLQDRMNAMPADRKRDMWNNLAQAAFSSVGTPTRKRGLAGMLPGLGVAGREFTERNAQSAKEYKLQQQKFEDAKLAMDKARAATAMGDYATADAYKKSADDIIRGLKRLDLDRAYAVEDRKATEEAATRRANLYITAKEQLERIIADPNASAKDKSRAALALQQIDRSGNMERRVIADMRADQVRLEQINEALLDQFVQKDPNKVAELTAEKQKIEQRMAALRYSYSDSDRSIVERNLGNAQR